MNKVLIVAFVLQFVWGFVPIASKTIIDEIPIELYIAIRWTISGIILAAFVFIAKSWKPISKTSFFKIVLLGLLGYGCSSFGTLYGIKTGGVANFAMMSALYPLATSTLSIFFLREKPVKLFYLALPVSVLGLFCMVVGKYQVSTLHIAVGSAFFILAGALLEALVFVFSKRTKDEMSTSQYLLIAQTSAAVVMWTLQLTAWRQFSSLAQMSTKGFAAILYVSLVACVLCYAVLYWLLKRMDGHRLALFEGVHTLSATGFGVLIFADPVSPLMWVGGAFILTGLVLGNIKLSSKIQTQKARR